MDLVDRLYHRLREAAGRQYPASSSPAFSVAELYQQLIPYRGVRVELGVLELAEYEHALLRLLSGERGYLRVHAPRVQEELRKELASPSPILGIYRDYATVQVELSPPGDLATVPERPRPAAAPPPLASPPPAAAPARDRPPAAAPPPAAHAGSCYRCHSPLPAEAELRFCPHCGSDQREAPCEQCGLTLKPEWSFCIRCGTRRPAAPSAP